MTKIQFRRGLCAASVLAVLACASLAGAAPKPAPGTGEAFRQRLAQDEVIYLEFSTRKIAALGIDPAVGRLDRVTSMVRELREAFVGIQSGAVR